jgi:protocatechuate 3,4-dioxygenase beta subunit
LAAGQFGLRGRVLDGQGTQQIPNAIVTVTSQAGYISSVTTNRDGQFSFASLPAGEYDFRVTVHGYAIYEREVSVAANGGVRELDIRMMVPADKQTVSVNELLAQKSSHPREEGL